MIGSMEQGSASQSASVYNGLQAKHKVFLSHSGAQKGFVEQLCVDLERCDRPPFFDKRRNCLPIGKEFPRLIFDAIEQCEVGVVVLSEEFFTSKWPMLELVAMTHVKKQKPGFTIMPVLLGLSLFEYRNVDNHMRWTSLWQSWAQCDSRIDLANWINVLQLLGPINALKYNIELGEVKFREEIVEAICRLVPLATQLDDSHVQGRSRLCKVIHERIKQSKVSSQYGVHVIGLHGFGGIGKTTFCKAMCNYLFQEFCGKVAHMELGSRSEEELMKDMLRRLTDMNLEHLGALNVNEVCYLLKKDMSGLKVFLAIDNVSSATRRQALTILNSKYGLGSVVLVTSRSLTDLMSLGISASECMEMPELEMEEARSLFLHHAVCVPLTYSSNKDDRDLVSSCIQRCFFKKGDGISYHYHPLALQTLGDQLGGIGYNWEQWTLRLRVADSLNPFGEPQHPVFSILRGSFDALNPGDQLLCMDVALFAPYINPSFRFTVFEWLGLVHGVSVTSVKLQLENLKRKSLLENVGDGLGRICMHDLWREFTKLEANAGEFEKRRWMFQSDECNAHEEAIVGNGDCLKDMRRMFIMEKGLMELQNVMFSRFPRVRVLKLRAKGPCVQKLDLSDLKDLKSLELDNIRFLGLSHKRSEVEVHPIGLGSLLSLGLLRWSSIPSDSSCIDEISHLTNLQVLELTEFDRAPDLGSLILLRVARFRSSYPARTIAGFSSKHTYLQFLDLSNCKVLESCPGVGELVALQELRLRDCSRLLELPNLGKLKQLRKLDVARCPLGPDLPGLGDLVSLVELIASGCSSLSQFPNMCNLGNLRILDVRDCKLSERLPGLNELVRVRYSGYWAPGPHRCWVCREKDHQAGFVGSIYVHCPNKLCYLCRKPGHTSLSCPDRTATEPGGNAAPRRQSLGLHDFFHERLLRSNLLASIPNKVDSAIIRLHSRRVTHLEFHPTNDNLLISGDKGGQVGIWDFEKVFNKTMYEDIHVSAVNGMKFHPHRDGMMYTASADGKVCFTDLESGTCSVVLDLNSDIWADSYPSQLHSMDLNLWRDLVLAGDNFGYLHQIDARANEVGELTLLQGSQVLGVSCHPVDSDIFVTSGSDYTARIWDMRMLSPDNCLAQLSHPRSVTAAYFSPLTGNKIMTTCLDNRIRVWDDLRADLSKPSREIVHSHNFRWDPPFFKAEWDPKDRAECLAVIGHFISDNFNGVAQHPIDFIDMSNGRIVEQVYDPSITSICTVNKLHPRLDCMATGSSRSLFIWRPKEVTEEVPEDEDTTTEGKKTTKLQIYEADGGEGKNSESDDDDFAFMKKKSAAKSNGAAGPSSCSKEKSKRNLSSSGDEDSDDDFERSRSVPPPSEGRVLRRRSKSLLFTSHSVTSRIKGLLCGSKA